MKKNILIIFGVIVAAALLLIYTNVSEPVAIPESAPEDTQIVYTYDAGFTGTFIQYFISSDSLEVYTQEYGDVSESQEYDITEQEFEQVYQLFVENEFASIEIVEEEVADMGGVSLQLEFNDEYRVIKSASGGDYVSEKHEEQLGVIIDGIEAFVLEYQE